jgi:hypothetical protein
MTSERTRFNTYAHARVFNSKSLLTWEINKDDFHMLFLLHMLVQNMTLYVMNNAYN